MGCQAAEETTATLEHQRQQVRLDFHLKRHALRGASTRSREHRVTPGCRATTRSLELVHKASTTRVTPTQDAGSKRCLQAAQDTSKLFTPKSVGRTHGSKTPSPGCPEASGLGPARKQTREQDHGHKRLSRLAPVIALILCPKTDPCLSISRNCENHSRRVSTRAGHNVSPVCAIMNKRHSSVSSKTRKTLVMSVPALRQGASPDCASNNKLRDFTNKTRTRSP